MRYPAVAGQFYAGTPHALRKQIEECFLHQLGPGRIPVLDPDGERRIRGIISPHAGYMFSGPVAAHGFAALAEDGFPDVFVILGPNHHGLGSGVALTTHDFDMPLGVMRVDRELAGRMRTGIIDDTVMAHRHEHSIEVQLPFIQYFRNDVCFVPVSMLMQDYDSAVEVGGIIRHALEGTDAVVIASTDLSHYVPPGEAERLDGMAIDRMLGLDTRGLYETVRKNGITMCGLGPVIAMMEAVRGTEAILLKHATSGDVRPMPDVVGYASIAVV